MNNQEDLAKLTVYIEENLRADQNKGIHFVDPRQLRDRVLTRQNHVVFGRRGAGKTTLLSSISQKEDAVIVYVNLESAKDGKLAATQAYVLRLAFEQLRLILKAKKTGFFLRCKIRSMEKRLSRLNQKETDDEVKKEVLHKNIEPCKKLFTAISDKLGGQPLYLALDDFYFIRQELQPEFLDYFHCLTKDTELYLKVGTVRERSTLYRADQNSYRGVEIGHDAHEIDIDYTMEKFAEMENFFHELLESANRESGANVKLENYFREDGFEELCRASGGVPRNFLGLFVRLANQHKKDEEPSAFIGVEEILEQTEGYVKSQPAGKKKKNFLQRWWNGFKNIFRKKTKAPFKIQKKQIKRETTQKLREFDKTVKEIRRKAKKIEKDLRKECLKDLKSYRKSKAAARKRLKLVKKAAEESLENAKQNLAETMQDIETKLEQCKTYFV